MAPLTDPHEIVAWATPPTADVIAGAAGATQQVVPLQAPLVQESLQLLEFPSSHVVPLVRLLQVPTEPVRLQALQSEVPPVQEELQHTLSTQ